MSAYSESSITKYEFNDVVKEGFPLLIDDTTLSFKLGIRTKTLWYLLNARNDGKAYKCFSIPQYNEDGSFKKKREIQEPMPHLKKVHSVLNNLFASMPMDESISAYVKGKNCAEAARKHVRPRYVFCAETNDLLEGPETEETMDNLNKDARWLKRDSFVVPHDNTSKKTYVYTQPLCMIKIDIRNFFPSIKGSWIRRYFRDDVGYSHYVSGLLATLCSVKRTVVTKQKQKIQVRHLPQGAPISGSLSNLIGYSRFGKKTKEYLEAHSPDWVYTIYSDDIIITHPSATLSFKQADEVRDTIMKFITDAGFEVNHEKVMIKRSESTRLKVLGCIVNDGILNIPSHVKNKVTCMIHNCATNGFESQCKPKQTVGGLLMYLRGMIEYMRSIRPDVAESVAAKLEDALTAHNIDIKPTRLEANLF